MNTSEFVNRHISFNETNKNEMLKKVGISSIDELISQTIPHSIRLQKDLSISEPLSEFEMLSHSKELASENQQFDSYIGLGYHPAILPAVIQRNILENPSWYSLHALPSGNFTGKIGSTTELSDYDSEPYRFPISKRFPFG